MAHAIKPYFMQLSSNHKIQVSTILRYIYKYKVDHKTPLQIVQFRTTSPL